MVTGGIDTVGMAGGARASARTVTGRWSPGNQISDGHWRRTYAGDTVTGVMVSGVLVTG
jgi:hypothetical protein